MPLLALPREILLEILECLSKATSDPVVEYWEQESKFKRRNMLCAGATCRTLRAASLPYIYSEVTLQESGACLLRFLYDYKYILPYIRKLTYYYHELCSTPPLEELFRDVLPHCTGLHSISALGWQSMEYGFSAPMSLEWIPSESRQSLECLHIETGLRDMLGCLQAVAKRSMENKEFGRLKDLRLDSVMDHETYTPEFNNEVLKLLDLETSGKVALEKLPQVRSLRLEMHAEFGFVPGPGILFAKMLPNIECLSLNSARKVTCTILNAYIDLKTKITELNIKEPLRVEKCPEHLCEIISKLSHGLSKLNISIGVEVDSVSTFCHALFRNIADWPLLADLTLEADRGCLQHEGRAGLDPGLMHHAMTELIRTHPQVRILLKQGAVALVDCEEGLKYIAPVEAFENLLIPPEIPGPLSEINFDLDIDFDDNDYEHDIEDTIEDYYSGQGDFDDDINYDSEDTWGYHYEG